MNWKNLLGIAMVGFPMCAVALWGFGWQLCLVGILFSLYVILALSLIGSD
jgi:hypothetical protein